MDHWSLVYPSRLHWKRFDSEWVVYEEASNQTLVLGAIEMDLLMCLSAGTLGAASLEEQVLDDLQFQDSDEGRLMVNAGMARLESAGLIKPMQDASISNQSR
jgi:hypothetical protein